jgi:signal peptidase II
VSDATSTATRVESALGRRLRTDAPFFLLAALIVVADQLTKKLVRDQLLLGESWPDPGWFVKFTHVTNSGAAFGILQGQTTFLIVTSLLGLGAIVLYYLYPPMEHGFLRAALGLQLGGAIGNLIDRVVRGEVTDFVDFRHFPAFNVADSAITVGVISIIAFFSFTEARETIARGSERD